VDADFLRAILDKPDDDGPRLVYADHLDETGRSERAEFIRVQCALENHDDPSGLHPDFGRLAGREARLVEFGGAWLTCGIGEMDDFTWNGTGGDGVTINTSSDVSLLWRRGFVSEVRAPLAALVGGPCPFCEFDRRQGHGDDLVAECRHCSATGRTPGILRALARAQPVTKVVATDLEVEYVDREPGFGGWGLVLDVQTLQQLGLHRWHHSREAALDAVGAALLRFAAAPHAATA
jgi:uncharacterized protein (TIGR02996 family)